MKYIRRYNESKTIEATNKTIKKIVDSEIIKLGSDGDLNHIDVSLVTNMKSIFWGSSFNGNISNWNVQNVRNMSMMFSNSNFKGNISRWNVENVTDMSHMFYYSPFNGDLTIWNVQNVRDMIDMFYMSPLKRREPWWYILRSEFIDVKSMYDSIEVYEWIDFKKKIIWKKRLNYALQDFGKEDSQIPQSIWGITIQ